MSNIHSVEEAYESLAEVLNYLSRCGETLSLSPTRPGMSAMISGYSGGVKLNPAKKFGEKWEPYKEGE